MVIRKAEGWGAISDTGHAAGGPIAMSTYLKYPADDTAAEQNLVILYQEPSESKLRLHLCQSSNGFSLPNLDAVGDRLTYTASVHDPSRTLHHINKHQPLNKSETCPREV